MTKNLPALVISGIAISQDAEGRFSLNDLHKAAGGESRHEPWRFLDLDATKGLIDAISNSPEMVNKNPVSVRPGRYGGSSVVKELVYRYAMWISPAFELKVIRAYDALATGAAKPDGQLADALFESLFARFIDLFPMLLAGENARLRIAQRPGVSVGEVLDSWGIKSVPGLIVALGNMLVRHGCFTGDYATMGKSSARMFNPDRVRDVKPVLLPWCEKFIQEKKGQSNLFPLKRAV